MPTALKQYNMFILLGISSLDIDMDESNLLRNVVLKLSRRSISVKGGRNYYFKAFTVP